MTKECNELGEMERVNLSLHTSSALFTFLSSDSWGEARPFGPPVPGHDGRTMRGTESGAYDPRFTAPLTGSFPFSVHSALTSLTSHSLRR